MGVLSAIVYKLIVIHDWSDRLVFRPSIHYGATLLQALNFKPNIHDAIWSHTIYKLQSVHYKIACSYVAYDVSYRIELLSIP